MLKNKDLSVIDLLEVNSRNSVTTDESGLWVVIPETKGCVQLTKLDSMHSAGSFF